MQEAYVNCASVEDLKTLLGRARAKRGMFEGDLVEGELEIGQIAGLIHDILPVETIIGNVIAEFNSAKVALNEIQF